MLCSNFHIYHHLLKDKKIYSNRKNCYLPNNKSETVLSFQSLSHVTEKILYPLSCGLIILFDFCSRGVVRPSAVSRSRFCTAMMMRSRVWPYPSSWTPLCQGQRLGVQIIHELYYSASGIRFLT